MPDNHPWKKPLYYSPKSKLKRGVGGTWPTFDKPEIVPRHAVKIYTKEEIAALEREMKCQS